jgi:type IV pilus assembly protein PilV
MFMKPTHQQRGSTLLEALIAMLILSFSVLGLIALQANLLRIGTQAQDRLEASMLAQNIAGMISADPSNTGCYALQVETLLPCPAGGAEGSRRATAWRGEVMAALPNASEPRIAVAANRTATITLAWRSSKDPASRNLVLVVQPTL